MGYIFYPQAPLNQSQNQGQMTPDARRRALQQQFAQQILGQPATTAAGGVGQLLAGIGQWQQRQPDSQFPQAPGGAQPSFLTGLGNLFTGNNNGGLY